MSGYEQIGEISFVQRPVCPRLFPEVKIKHVLLAFLMVLVTAISVGLVAWNDIEPEPKPWPPTTSVPVSTTTTAPTPAPVPRNYSFLLVNGISSIGDNEIAIDQIEVLDADTLTSKICPQKCNYPFPVTYTTGGLLKNDKVVVCGGKIKPKLEKIAPELEKIALELEKIAPKLKKIAQGDDAIRLCFSMNSTVQWELQAIMQDYRFGGASAVIKDGSALWVTGGIPHAKETEVVKSAGIVFSKSGRAMPEPRAYHCMMNIGETAMLVIGGKAGQNLTVSNSVRIGIESRTFDYTSLFNGPDLIYSRYDHACAVFKSEQHGNRPVALVAGGSDEDGLGLNIVEIWDFSVSDTTWVEFINLPIPMQYGPRMATTNEGLILTYGKDIWRLTYNPKFGYNWVEQEQKLQIERYGHVLLSVPSDKVDCQ